MNKLNLLLIVVLASLSIQCVKSRVTPYPNINYPPSDASNINIYYMPPPNMELEIIGEVEARGAPAASWSKVERYMKNEAAKIGGEAIILISSREEYKGTYTTQGTANAFIYGNSIYYTYNPGTSVAMKRKHVIGLVVKWKQK